jgi:glycosyltransferase involved in cell wall biosynthesis
MNTLRVSIIIPAFNEGRDIIPVLERISEAVTMSFECLVVIDNPEDLTIDFVNEF